MQFHLSRDKEGTIHIQARMEGPGGLLGDFQQGIRPGENFLGWSYQELFELGPGSVDLDSREKIRGPARE